MYLQQKRFSEGNLSVEKSDDLRRGHPESIKHFLSCHLRAAVDSGVDYCGLRHAYVVSQLQHRSACDALLNRCCWTSGRFFSVFAYAFSDLRSEDIEFKWGGNERFKTAPGSVFLDIKRIKKPTTLIIANNIKGSPDLRYSSIVILEQSSATSNRALIAAIMNSCDFVAGTI
ncbi:hypothetical protein BH11VER1_BH11VER1_41270 [soil metagenome]